MTSFLRSFATQIKDTLGAGKQENVQEYSRDDNSSNGMSQYGNARSSDNAHDDRQFSGRSTNGTQTSNNKRNDEMNKLKSLDGVMMKSQDSSKTSNSPMNDDKYGNSNNNKKNKKTEESQRSSKLYLNYSDNFEYNSDTSDSSRTGLKDQTSDEYNSKSSQRNGFKGSNGHVNEDSSATSRDCMRPNDEYENDKKKKKKNFDDDSGFTESAMQSLDAVDSNYQSLEDLEQQNGLPGSNGDSRY